MERANGKGDKVISMASGPPLAKETALLRWPAPGKPCHGIITQWPMHQLVIHWTREATMLCQVPLMRPCQACADRLKRRWIGFVGAYDPGSGRHVLMEITAGAACDLPLLLEVEKSYVGYKLTTFRMGSAKTSRVGAKLEKPIPGSAVPAPIDYAVAIARVFGLEEMPKEVLALYGKGGE